MKQLKFIIGTVILGLIASCSTNNEEKSNENKVGKDQLNPIVGYLYTSTNGEGDNSIIQIARFEDGSLGEEKVYSTGGKGGSLSTAPVNGDYDSQGALKLIKNHLLCVNTGDNTITVFKVNETNGELTKVSLTSSHGERPVSIASYPTGKDNEYWIVVANQWGTPTALFEGNEYVELPNKEFFKNDLKTKDITDQNRNIVLYKFNSKTSKLNFEKVIDTYERNWGGPVQVEFSNNGQFLAVSTWGIPHFVTSSPKVDFVKPSRIYVYSTNGGEFSNRKHFEEEGLIGAVGFNWSAQDDRLYVSIFNPIKKKDSEGLIVLKLMQNKIEKESSHETGAPEDIDYACWTALSPDKKHCTL